jgi:lipid-A-disaccharide synthase
VGHPYFDQLQQLLLDQRFLADQTGRPGELVTILPGSRTQEVLANLPSLLRAASHVQGQVPSVRFAIASYNERQAELARGLVRQAGVEAELWVGKTHELMQLATCCLACSGSVSLELLHFTKPTVILYRVPRFLYVIVKPLIQVRFITLVNLLASPQPFRDPRRPSDEQRARVEEMLMPEYPSYEDKSRELADRVVAWLTDDRQREACIAEMARLKERFAHPGASRRAAAYLLRHLSPAVTSPGTAAAPPRAA